MRIVCPVHSMPDCSPMLNGCSRVIELHAEAEKLRGIIDSAFGTDAAHGLIATALVDAGWEGPVHRERWRTVAQRRVRLGSIDLRLLGNRVRDARTARGLSQTQAGGGASAAMVSRIEQGMRRPSYAVLERIAEVLEVSLDDWLRPAVDTLDEDVKAAIHSALCGCDGYCEDNPQADMNETVIAALRAKGYHRG